jgi:hypothetical protein
MRQLFVLAAAVIVAIPITLAAPVAANAATITVTTFSDLQTAFTADNSDVVLGADIVAALGQTLDTPSGTPITLDLAGHSLSITSPPAGEAAVRVGAGTSLIINDSVGGGTLTATGADDGAGIGGDLNMAGGNVTINGGTIKATGGIRAAGIGGGNAGIGGGNGGTTTINGGTTTATGGDDGAGIGGGLVGNGGTTTINGGTTTATGGDNGAGIGSGELGNNGGTTTINGGTTTATGGIHAAGIGGGNDGGTDGGGAAVTITGGSISATGGGSGAGIGNGYGGLGGSTDIHGSPTGGSDTTGGSSTDGAGGAAPTFTNTVTPGVSYTATSTDASAGSTVILFHYLVTIDPGNGSAAATQTVDYGATATAPTVTRDGYAFVRWESGGTTFSFSTPITGPTTVDAIWQVMLATTGVDPTLPLGVALLLLLLGGAALVASARRRTAQHPHLR